MCKHCFYQINNIHIHYLSFLTCAFLLQLAVFFFWHEKKTGPWSLLSHTCIWVWCHVVSFEASIRYKSPHQEPSKKSTSTWHKFWSCLADGFFWLVSRLSEKTLYNGWLVGLISLHQNPSKKSTIDNHGMFNMTCAKKLVIDNIIEPNISEQYFTLQLEIKANRDTDDSQHLINYHLTFLQ